MVKACKGISLRSFAKDSKCVELAIFAEFCFRWRRCANSYFLSTFGYDNKGVQKRIFARICLELHRGAST